MAEFEFGNPAFDEDYEEGGVEDVEDEVADDKDDRKDFLEEMKKLKE